MGKAHSHVRDRCQIINDKIREGESRQDVSIRSTDCEDGFGTFDQTSTQKMNTSTKTLDDGMHHSNPEAAERTSDDVYQSRGKQYQSSAFRRLGAAHQTHVDTNSEPRNGIMRKPLARRRS